jgi:hypothetical protein
MKRSRWPFQTYTHEQKHLSSGKMNNSGDDVMMFLLLFLFRDFLRFRTSSPVFLNAKEPPTLLQKGKGKDEGKQKLFHVCCGVFEEKGH